MLSGLFYTGWAFFQKQLTDLKQQQKTTKVALQVIFFLCFPFQLSAHSTGETSHIWDRRIKKKTRKSLIFWLTRTVVDVYLLEIGPPSSREREGERSTESRSSFKSWTSSPAATPVKVKAKRKRWRYKVRMQSSIKIKHVWVWVWSKQHMTSCAGACGTSRLIALALGMVNANYSVI